MIRRRDLVEDSELPIIRFDTAFRLLAVDHYALESDARAPFLALLDLVRAAQPTVHVTLSLDVGRDEPGEFTGWLQLAMVDSDERELRALVRHVEGLFGSPASPWKIAAVDPAAVPVPPKGDMRFIRQESVDVVTSSGMPATVPARFGHPGPGAWDRLLGALRATKQRTFLAITVTPTQLTPDEEQSIDADAFAEPDDVIDPRDFRVRATFADVAASFRTPTFVLQVVVVGERQLDEVDLRAIAGGLTSSFDTLNGDGFRVAAAPRRLISGGCVIEPVRSPAKVLRLLNVGRPWIGTRERSLRDLVTFDELSFLMSWPVGSNGLIPGVGTGSFELPPMPSGEGVLDLGTAVGGLPVRLSMADRQQHVAVFGGSGSGKTTLVADWVRQDIRAGHAVWVLDSAGNLPFIAASFVPDSERRRVTVVDPSNPEVSDELDLLRLSDDPLVQAQVLAAIERGLTTSLSGDQHAAVGKANLMALLAGLAFTGGRLSQFQRLIDDEAFAKDVADRLDLMGREESYAPTLRRFHQGSKDSVADLRKWMEPKAEAVLNPRVMAVLDAESPTRSLCDITEAGSVTLVRADPDVLQVMLAVLHETAKTRKDKSTPISLYLDESQFTAGDELEMLMNGARKLGVAITVVTQDPGNLRGSMNNVLTNAATVLCGRVRGSGARVLEDDLSLQPGTLRSIENYRFTGRLQLAGESLGPVDVRSRRVASAAMDWPEGWTKSALWCGEDQLNSTDER